MPGEQAGGIEDIWGTISKNGQNVSIKEKIHDKSVSVNFNPGMDFVSVSAVVLFTSCDFFCPLPTPLKMRTIKMR